MKRRLTLVDFREDDDARELSLWIVRNRWNEQEDTYMTIVIR